MSKSSAMVLSALAVSAAIVAVAWTLGGPAERPVEEDLVSPRFDAPLGLPAPRQQGQSPLQRVERAEFRNELPDGRVQVFSFAAIEPRSDFVSDFTDPRAELYLTGGRLVVIEAASGTFLHPGNDPQRGGFDRDVVVTFYEAADDASLDVSDASQIVFRLFLDEQTNFNRDRGRIFTEGPVRLIGPSARFTGVGLDLSYSAKEKRVAEMIVARGDELRLRRDPAGRSAGDVAASSTPREPSALPEGEPTEPPAAAPPADDEPRQYYRARFDRDVLVRVGPDDEARLTGDALDLAFAFVEAEDPEARAALNPRPPRDARLASADAAAAGSDSVVVTDAAPALPLPPAVPETELFTPRDDDILITWAGPLTLVPLDSPPPPLQTAARAGADARDQALLTLTGTPARVVVADPDRPGAPTTVAADALAYTTGIGHLDALASPERPFRMHAPGQGTLTGQRLAFRPDAPEYQADVLGPGRLTAAPPDAEPSGAENADQDPSEAQDSAVALDVQFARRLRLAFAPADESGDADDSPIEALGPLVAADFQGEVRARAADPDRPDEPPLDLFAEALRVAFDPAVNPGAAEASSPALRRIHARRNVLAEHAGRSLAADDLVADFVTPPLTAEDESENVDANPRLAVVTATGRVTAFLPEGDPSDADGLAEPAVTTLTAHRLVATPDPDGDDDFESGTLLLLADADDPQAPPARITTPTALLVGPRLELNQAEQSLHAQGPGRLTQTQGDETLAVAFQDTLTYAGNARPFPTADVLGQIVATSNTPTQRARLAAHRLALTFTPEASTEGTSQNHSNPATPLPPLQLRTAHATADPEAPAVPVELAAQTHPADQPEDPVNRLTVFGPEVFLDQTPADDRSPYAEVTGQGELRVEDYTPDEPAVDADAPDGLRLAGQGFTVFRWNERLHLDLLHNDLTMHGRARMNHNPLDGQPNVLLVADRLRADVTENPPFTQLLLNTPTPEPSEASDAAAPEPALRQVQLDGDVVVQQETRRVFADQLLFTAADRNVLLQAYPGNAVRAEDQGDRRANLEADAILWNLDTDRLRVTDYRGGLVPIE